VEKGVSISGVVVRDLGWKDNRLVALQENDHILRRFGQIDVVKLEPGKSLETLRKAGADEVWALISGEAILQMADQRHESPTLDQTVEITLNGNSPQAVLIPFGVLAHITGQSAGSLLRLTTHADELFPEEHIFSKGGRDNQDG
jgi:dTDP-4-dehydrorhamnose 3,5-epimerase-like enzyme